MARAPRRRPAREAGTGIDGEGMPGTAEAGGMDIGADPEALALKGRAPLPQAQVQPLPSSA
jgi:hypothetical protein